MKSSIRNYVLCLGSMGMVGLNLHGMEMERAQYAQRYFYVPSAQELKEYSLDCWQILKAVFRDQKHTAAFTASSPWLTEQIASYVPENEPVRILEVGPGPGPVTSKIIERMGEGAQFEAVEFNKDLFNQLKAKLGDKENDRVHFYNAAIEQWSPEHETEQYYDLIISTIPVTQLPLETMETILEKYKTMLKPGGTLVYITLCGARTLTGLVKTMKSALVQFIDSYLWPLDRERCAALANDCDHVQFLGQWSGNHFEEIETKIVLLNMPPNYIMALRMKDSKEKSD